jgi:hypothetical protein
MRLLLQCIFKKSMHTSAAILLVLISISYNSYCRTIPYNLINTGSVLNYQEPGARMFLIAVIDSDDKIIGERCATDLDAVTSAFEELADWMFIKMEEPKIIMGDAFSKDAVNDAIDNWLAAQHPDKNDIVVFYYSGHGFRYPGDASNFPRMWLKTAQDQNIESTNLRMKEDVYDRITNMGAGVNLILSDCCNTTAAGDNANFDNITVPTRKKVSHKRENDDENSTEDDNAEKLFTPDHPLSILVSAADKGEYAGGKAETGGFFTNYFLEALTKCVYDFTLQPTWENIFKYTDEQASYWARSAECPAAKHTEQGRCVQTVTFITNDSTE